MEKVLVVGARPGSLGHCVAQAFFNGGYKVTTAGVTEEDVHLDITSEHRITSIVEMGFQHVICTAGVNMPGTITGPQWRSHMALQMQLNYLGPMLLVGEWVDWWKDQFEHETPPMRRRLNFVAVSSNSAHVARSRSGGYCASKAALSMGIRCAARESADYPFNIWAVEPGWMEGTPMSDDVRRREGEAEMTMHRIPGGLSLNPAEVAQTIMGLVHNGGKELNGTTLRIDGGDQ